MSAKEGRGEPLHRWEVVGLWLLLAVFLLFGVLVEYRSAFLRRRMTDLNCYLRAGWCVRQGGASLYHTSDDNGWHYNYPPLYAILMAPLADPPRQDWARFTTRSIGLAGSPNGFGPLLAAADVTTCPAPFEVSAPVVPHVPWAVSVAIVYLLNLALLALALQLLASALEKTAGEASGWRQPRGSRRWFSLRVFPLCVCLVPIAHTLMRGQANLVLMALFCGMIGGMILGRCFAGGLCLAGAICIKVFPAFLLLIPLVRRDLRFLAGCGVGLFVGLVLIPVLALGPTQTWTCYRELAEVLLGPALGLGSNQSRADEIINAGASDSQSFQLLLNHLIHFDPSSRPKEVDPLARELGRLLGGLLTLLTLAAGWRHRYARGPALVVFVGALILVMLLLSPVCHTHYFSLLVPVVMGLQALYWERQAAAGQSMAVTRIPRGVLVLAVLFVAVYAAQQMPGQQRLREMCLLAFPVLAVWLTACIALWRWPAPRTAPQPSGVVERTAA
jgi:hypothetical protein